MAFTGSTNLTAPSPPLHLTTTTKPRTSTLQITNSISQSSPQTTTKNLSLNWTPNSWKSKTAHQQPIYPNQDELNTVLQTIESFPPIVFAGEARKLEERLASAAVGEAFLLQGGDCAESFKEFNGVNIRDTFRVLLQMGIVLTFGAQMPVIKMYLLL